MSSVIRMVTFYPGEDMKSYPAKKIRVLEETIELRRGEVTIWKARARADPGI
jgi:hypothetical protein